MKKGNANKNIKKTISNDPKKEIETKKTKKRGF
jgi:hypothetical protein